LSVIDRTKETTPPTYKLSLVRGDTLFHTFSVSRDGYDFAGTTARCQIKQAKNAQTAFATVTPTLIVSELGKLLVTVRVEYADTLWRPGTYHADVELTLPGNVRKTVSFLEIQVLQDVTH
jgi:hypothetical protein